jgi:hypothetical protein
VKWALAAVVLAAVVLAALVGIAMIPVGDEPVDATPAPDTTAVRRLDLSAHSDTMLPTRLPLLFIHHSVGGQLMAPQGPVVGESCIYDSFPTGGDLRAKLTAAGYEVHEASYDSAIGGDTDLFDWLPKFRDRMDDVLRVDQQDTMYEDSRRNRVVMFKSCFPNNWFVDEGEPPGNPEGPELTVWNGRATLRALLPYFAAHPETLFVYVTAPPVAPVPRAEPLWKWLLKAALGRPSKAEHLRRSGALARQFNSWVVGRDGWLADYEHHNVVVFDYYDILTGHGRSNLSVYPTENGTDAHPSLEGQQRAADALPPFLNRAVRYAGLVEAEAAHGNRGNQELR